MEVDEYQTTQRNRALNAVSGQCGRRALARGRAREPYRPLPDLELSLSAG
jgi:hypothetical protein